ncbi:Uu.00g131120.m01.CDS01 [Anthostomella pinea]|uniref:Uu.00g131120.m01.CDS01 n=1 Tax=Anthostomella pinea TaxID=933095 RepID=A0AAI8VIU9_9PEZI|nr:Uu.00g131120.m01.CDS01 [Anthostomella pinea]
MQKQQTDVQVIVAGLPRTGTLSLKWALDKLGYGPSFHLMDIKNQFQSVKRSAEVVKVVDQEERQSKLRELFNGYSAVLEQPASTCLPDLLEIYPNAKVILSMRSSPEVWLDSWKGLGVDVRGLQFRLLGYWAPGVLTSSDLYRAWTITAAQNHGISEPCVELYHKHNAWVESLVPEERLLRFNCTQGWAPLIEFLDVQKVTEGQLGEFPRANQRVVLRSLKRAAMLYGLGAWVLMFCALYMVIERFAPLGGGLKSTYSLAA